MKLNLSNGKEKTIHAGYRCRLIEYHEEVRGGMMKTLGKKPPGNNIWSKEGICSLELAEHFHQSLIEAADELQQLADRGCGFKTLERLAKKIRISAGYCEVKP